jgi:hypothetical protein
MSNKTTVAIVLTLTLAAIGVGTKLYFFSASAAEAEKENSINVLQMHCDMNTKTLPDQKVHDKTFIFPEDD